MTMEERMREIDEAIKAGNDALNALSEAEHYLASARSFGIWDMLGGGFFSSLLKHSRMEDAQRCVEEAQYALQRFSRELKDVNMQSSLNIDCDGLTRFVDIFMDNFLVDMMVQSRINEARRNVAEAKREVKTVVDRLYDMRRGC